MIGLFGFSEVLEHLYRGPARSPGRLPAVQGRAIEQFAARPVRLMLRSRWLVVRSSLLGVFVGFLPGAGADIGAWVASSVQKMTPAREPDLELDRTVLAGTTSNNAAVASAWIPALALGLPGDTVTAMVLGVFLMKGITPGPLLFENNMALVWSLYLTFILANTVLLPCYGFLTARLAALIVRVPFNLLLSMIAGICVVGAYAINNNPIDVWVMGGMGLVAFLLRRGGFPLAQVVLGMVLGPILEQSFMVSAIKSSWNAASFIERPLALALMATTLVLVFFGLRFGKRLTAAASAKEPAEPSGPQPPPPSP
jgi:TctA family transporter